jgi:branched-subunit amino acid aminotransferase/4-amino-4-deoxychorismate lyase
VLELAQKNHIEVTEGAFPIEHILSAEEVFLTSSTREITRVASINFHQFNSKILTISERLLAAYQNYVSLTTRPPRLRF